MRGEGMQSIGRLEGASAGPVRVLDGLISRHEKPVLLWFARHMPAAVQPDHLTLLGVAGAALTAFALLASHLSPAFLWLAVAGLLLNWFGDSLDGTLARYRLIERPRYGFFIDHTTDIASQVMIVLGLGMSPFLRFDVVCLGLIAYLALGIYSYVKLHVSRPMQLTYYGVGPTEVRAFIAAGLMIAALVEVPVYATPFGHLSVFDAITIAGVIFAAVSVTVMFVTDATKLARIDPPRYGVPGEVAMRQVGEIQSTADLPLTAARPYRSGV